VMDFIVTQVPPRLMGIIYSMEKAGTLGSWWMAAKKPVVDFLKAVTGAIAYPVNYVEAKTKEATQGLEDVIKALALAIETLNALLKPVPQVGD
jgi:hypothetical protein